MTDPNPTGFIRAPQGRGTFSTAAPRNIFTRLADHLLGVQVERGIGDDVEMLLGDDGYLLRPYIDLQFGAPIRTTRDRSIVGERSQPATMTFTADCWGRTEEESTEVAAAVSDLCLGWVPEEDNATEIAAFGGGDFRLKDSQGRPTRFCQRRQFQYGIGMATL